MQGRDAVFLDEMRYDRSDGGSLTLHGECNGALATDASERWVRYTLRFLGVIAFRVVELDSWFHCFQL